MFYLNVAVAFLWHCKTGILTRITSNSWTCLNFDYVYGYDCNFFHGHDHDHHGMTIDDGHLMVMTTTGHLLL